jgi:acid phosphatase family membrane protein YuiD
MPIRDILAQLLRNDILWLSIIVSSLAQALKPFIHHWRTGVFDWHQLAGTGGMPSSHSAMVSALATGVGFEQGFDSAPFAIATIFAMIVTYDASGVRRHAGTHALFQPDRGGAASGHPLEDQFNELPATAMSR